MTLLIALTSYCILRHMTCILIYDGLFKEQIPTTMTCPGSQTLRSCTTPRSMWLTEWNGLWKAWLSKLDHSATPESGIRTWTTYLSFWGNAFHAMLQNVFMLLHGGEKHMGTHFFSSLISKLNHDVILIQQVMFNTDLRFIHSAGNDSTVHTRLISYT